MTAAQRWRKNHPDAGAAASRRWRALHPGYRSPARLQMLTEIELLKSDPCLDCGNKFPTECMDFDHRNPKHKRLAVGTMVAHGYSKRLVMKEIKKCDLVCANCHRIRTRKRKCNGRTNI